MYHILLHHMDRQVNVLHLPGEEIASGCTLRRGQARVGLGVGGDDDLRKFCWETLNPSINLDDTFHLPIHYGSLSTTLYGNGIP